MATIQSLLPSSILYRSRRNADLEHIIVQECNKRRDDIILVINIAQMLLDAEVGELQPFQCSSSSVLVLRKLELLHSELIPLLPRKTVLSWLDATLKTERNNLVVTIGTCWDSTGEEKNQDEILRNKLVKLFARIVHLEDKDIEADRRLQLLKSMSSKKSFIKEEFWNGVIGYDEVKRSLDRLVRWKWYHTDELTRMGVSSGSGVLLYGPSGCGKTYLAQRLGEEVGVYFFSIKASDVYSKWYGESEKVVREVFATARAKRPCILFLDEVDAIAPSRQTASSENGSENAVGSRVLSTLLNEMDGIDTENQGVIVLAATNRIEAVDDAALRPGRFGSRVYVDLPNNHDRELLFRHILAKTPLGEDVDFHSLVVNSFGYSVARIQSVCSMASYCALATNKTRVSKAHFEQCMFI